MAQDRRLTRDFWLHEFPGWENATELQAAKAEKLAVLLLQPARRRWGRIRPTSWLRSSGAHASGDFVDFVPIDAHAADPVNGVQEVHGWLATYHPGSFGELLYEIPGPGEVTPHIHASRPGQGGDGQVLTQVGWNGSQPRFDFGFLLPAAAPFVVVLGLATIAVLLAGGAGS